MAPFEIQNLIETAVVSVLALGTIIPLANAIAKRIATSKRAAPALSAPLDSERMDRMERAIEAISVEVERITESQRFMTKLLSEGEKTASLSAPR